MPDTSASPLVVTRTIEVGPDTTVQLRVPRATALQWCPEFAHNERLLRAAADGHAHWLVHKAIRASRVSAGRWCATFPGGDCVEIEAVT